MGTRSTSYVASEETLPSKECWEVVERAAASTHLNRAARLREFLFYVSGKALNEGSSEVHEQEIGVVVFGRQPDYDTSQDNIVRVNATELRKRIDAYFAGEGAHEPLVFQIPRGSYTPLFRRRVEPPVTPVEMAPPAPIELPPAVAPAPPLLRRFVLPLALAAAVVFAILCGVEWRQNQTLRRTLHPWLNQPALASFWPRFLDAQGETDIVIGDTSFALVEDITGQSISLSDYMHSNYTRLIQSPDLSDDRRADLGLLVSRLNGSVGDFRVAQRIQALDPASTNLSLQFAREYTADAIKRHNAILIGARKSDPWVDLFSDQLNFTIEYDPKLNQSFVKNHNPRPGEQPVYAAPINPYASSGYSIIAFLPNPSHTAATLIFAGTDSQATDAAGEFLTSEASLETLLKKFRPNQIPYFEVLLKTTRLSGTPFNAEIVAVRTY